MDRQDKISDITIKEEVNLSVISITVVMNVVITDELTKWEKVDRKQRRTKDGTLRILTGVGSC